jgi:hypothetical protein
MDTATMRKRTPASALFDAKIVLPAIRSAFVKLDPRVLIKNPVMFVLEIVTVLTTVIFVRDLFVGGANILFELQIILWLWATILFANFSEAVAEGRGKAQADFAAPEPHHHAGEAADRSGPQEPQAGAGHDPEGRRPGAGRGRRHDSLRRRDRRRHRVGQRSGDHRRVGSGHP